MHRIFVSWYRSTEERWSVVVKEGDLEEAPLVFLAHDGTAYSQQITDRLAEELTKLVRKQCWIQQQVTDD